MSNGSATTDGDLAAVRELRAGSAEPTDLAVARVRRRVLTGLDGSVPSTVYRRRTWLTVASAAAAMVAVVGLVVVIQDLRGGTGPSWPFGAGPPAAAESAPGGSAPANEASDGPRPPGSVVDPPTGPPANLPDIDAVVTPLTVAPGQLLYVRETSPATDILAEEWIDPQGAILLRSLMTGGGFTASPGEIDAQRALLVEHGPSLARPTPDYLRTLPTDPAALLALITDQIGRSGSGTIRADLIFKNSLGLLRSIEPLLTAPQRLTFLAALARAPGAREDQAPRTFDGRDVYVVEQRSDFGTAGFITDRATGRIIGGYATGLAGDPLKQAQHWQFALVDTVSQRP